MSIPGLIFHAPLTTDLTLNVGVGPTIFARTSTATVIVEGVMQSVASGVIRFTGNGLRLDGPNTNLALRSRDYSNATWIKLVSTALMDAVGLDGVANSASTLTATLANAAILQLFTLGATTHTYSVDIRRKTGTGTIEISDDSFSANIVDVTALINSSTYTRVSITNGNANPTIGIRVTDAGDELEVDNNQLETQGFASSRIITLGSTVTRDEDQLSFGAANWVTLNDNFSACMDLETVSPSGSGAQSGFRIQGASNNTNIGLNGGNNPLGTYAAISSVDTSREGTDGRYRSCFTWDGATNQKLYSDTVLGDTDATVDETGTITSIRMGRLGVDLLNFYGELSNFRIYDIVLTQNQINNELGNTINGVINSGINSPINTLIN